MPDMRHKQFGRKCNNYSDFVVILYTCTEKSRDRHMRHDKGTGTSLDE